MLVWVLHALLLAYFAAHAWVSRRHGVRLRDRFAASRPRIWLSTACFVALTLVLFPWLDASQRALLLAIDVPLLAASLALFALPRGDDDPGAP